MYRILLLVVCAAFLAFDLCDSNVAAQAPGLEVSYDRFKDETIVRLNPAPVLRSASPFREVDFSAERLVRHSPSRDAIRDEVDQYPKLVFTVRSTELMFTSDRQELILLTDRARLVKPATVVESTAKYRRAGDPPITQANPYVYTLWVTLMPDELRQMGRIKKVEGRLGTIEFALAEPELAALRAFAEAKARR